jgi:hypothetical protein
LKFVLTDLIQVICDLREAAVSVPVADGEEEDNPPPPSNPFFRLMGAQPSAPPADSEADQWHDVDLGNDEDPDAEYEYDRPLRVVPVWKFWALPNYIYYRIHPEREPKLVRKKKKGDSQV